MKKRVCFNEEKNTVRVLVHWDFAHRQARQQCNFQQAWADRVRFNRRIEETEEILNPFFAEKHRNNMYKTRFLNKEVT